MRYLRQNTATRVTVGPFLDVTDAKTPEVALTATNEKLTFVVDDAGVPTLVLDTNATASGGNNDLVHITGDDAGYYDLELAAANVNYVGRAMLTITYATDHLPVFHEFTILTANAYDALFGTGVGLRADIQGVAGSATAATNLNKASLSYQTATVDTTSFSATSTAFECDDITEATTGHYIGRLVLFTSGVLQYQAARITAYSIASGRGHFTVTTMTEAPGNDDTLLIV